MRLGQFTAGDAAIVVLLQRFQADGAKNFFRSREAGQEPLEIVGSLDATAKLICEHRFRGPRRADDQQVIGRKQRRQRAVDQIGAFQKHLPQFFANLFKFVVRIHGRG